MAWKCFQGPLDNSTAIVMQRKPDHASTQLACKYKPLLVSPKVEELLDDIVPIDVDHQAASHGNDLIKNKLDHVGIDYLQFLLEETGAMLIFRHFYKGVLSVLQPRDSWKVCDWSDASNNLLLGVFFARDTDRPAAAKIKSTQS